MKGHVRIGISGWSYADWKGIFYPRGMKTTDWLTHYAQTFDNTELNASFYHLPKAQTVLNWRDKVYPGFKFCAKLNKYLTHNKKLHEPEEPLQRFFEVFDPIHDYLGPILIQLPPSLKYNADTAAYFYNVLTNKYTDYQFAIEPRHDSWLNKEAVKQMEQYGVAWVISQSGVGFPYAEYLTAKTIYIRFHGPGALYASAYTNEQLKEYAKKVRKWIAEGHDVWIYFNNCYNGVAIENALTIKDMINN